MNYEVKCTHCLSLLKNLKKYANAKYTMHQGEVYIEIDDISERIYIEDIEMYQVATYKYYNRLINLIEK